MYSSLDIPAEVATMAKERNFEVKLCKIGAAEEQTRPPRLVRIAVVQNAIVKPTTDPVKDQVNTSFIMLHWEDPSFSQKLQLQ